MAIISNFIYFLLLISLFIFAGNQILKKFLKLQFKSFLENFLFSLIFSLSAALFLIYAALIFNLGFLVRPISLFFLILGLISAFFKLKHRAIWPRIKPDIFLTLLSLFLAIPMVLITARSGWRVRDGVEFVGVNAHDGLWHLALIGELKNHFPPQYPLFSGIPLKDYHYLLDLLIAKFSLVFNLNEMDLYFRFFPVLISIVWCLSTFLLAQKYFQNKQTSYLTVFLSVMGGSFSYLLLIFHPAGINLDSHFGVSSPISSLINLQFAFSIPILTLTFYAFINFIQEKGFGWGIIAAFFTGILFGIKIYAGIIAFWVIGIVTLLSFLKTKKIKNIWLPLVAGIIGIFVYLPTSTGKAGLVFAPGEMVRSIIQGPLSWTLWEIQRQIYAEHNNFIGLSKIGFYSFTVFIFGNLGTRILGTYEIIRFRKSAILSKYFGIFSFALVLPFIIPLIFIQSVTPFNIIQFWWYFLYLMSFLTAVFVWSLLQGKAPLVKFILLATIIILTLPSAIFVLGGYLFPQQGPYNVPNPRLEASEFLKGASNPNQTILEIPQNSQGESYNFSWPDIAAFSQRRTFLGPEMIEFPYLDKDRRQQELGRIIKPLNCQLLNPLKKENCGKEIVVSYETLMANQIDYIVSPQSLFWLEENSKMASLVFKKENIFIYELKK